MTTSNHWAGFQISVLLAALTWLTGCAALAQAPVVCTEHDLQITQGQTSPLTLKESHCIGPKR